MSACTDNVIAPCSVPLPAEVTNEQLHWHQPFLLNALLTSYGVQYDMVRKMVRRSPAGHRAGGVIICDNYEHDTEDAGFDVRSHAPYVVVMPPFFDSKASTRERARLEKGTMHPKLQLLEFDGGTPETRFLRLVISSANLGDYSHTINNQFWAHDFFLRADLSAAAPAADAVDSRFKDDLLAFIHALLRPLAR